MPSAIKRLGLLLPSSGTVQEADFYRRVPGNVTVHSARMRLVTATEADEIRMRGGVLVHVGGGPPGCRV
jgi:maleate cis-trans isomerase